MKSYTTHNRFQVSCSVCGHLEAFKTLAEAKRYAENATGKHTAAYEKIAIFDLMAKVGNPELYTANGGVISRRS